MIEINKIQKIQETIDLLRGLTIEDMKEEKMRLRMSDLKRLLEDYSLVFKRLRI